MDYDKLAKQFGGTTAPVNAPDKTDFDALAKQFGGVSAAQPTEERGVLGYLGDVGAAFGAGAGQAVAAPGQLYRTFISKETEPGAIEQLGKRAAEYWEEKKSATQRAKERAVEQKVEAAEQAGAGILGQAGVAFGEVITDPALLSTYIAQSLPQVIGGGGVGAGVKGGTKLLARKAAAEASKETIEKYATKAGVSAAVATAALSQGADVGSDTFDEAVDILKKQGYSEADAKQQALELSRKATVNATLASLATQMLPGGRTIESALVRGGMGKGVVSGAVKGALGEMPSEGLEEGSGAFFKNLALSEIDPTRDISKGIGLQAGVGAAAGAGQGAAFGALGGRGERAAEEAKAKSTEEGKPKVEAAKKQKLSPEEQAIADLEAESAERRTIEEANEKLAEAESELEPETDMGGRAAPRTEQPDVGGGGLGVPVSQPAATESEATEPVAGGVAVSEGLTGAAPEGAVGAPATLTEEQVNNLFAAGITASLIDYGFELVKRFRDKGLQDVLLTPITRDHAAGLTSEEIATKNKIDAPFALQLQVGMGLVPNEKAKAAAVETPAVETPAVETPAVETPAVETPAVETPAAEPQAAESVTDLLGQYFKYEEQNLGRERQQVYSKLAEKSADELFSAIRQTREQQRALLSKNGRRPARGTAKLKLWEKLGEQESLLISLWDAADRKERQKKKEAPAAETPAAETPAAETPAVETPAVETPAVETPAVETPAVETPAKPAQDRFSDWQVITQEDDPNPFPEGMEFAVHAGAAGILEFFKTKKEADNWLQQEIEFQKSLTPATETPTTEPAPKAEVTVAKRAPAEAGEKGEMRSTYTMSDGSTYQIEIRKDGEFHLVGVADENESYLGDTRGEAERALTDDKNSGRLDQIVGKGTPRALLSVRPSEQQPSLEELHPTVSQALFAGDLNGMLKAISNTTSGFTSSLAKRLLELDLPTVLTTGRDRARQLVRKSIDYGTAAQQKRLFAYVQTSYPGLYAKYFERYDAEENLERVYEGLKELAKYDTKEVSAEFKDVLKAYEDTIGGISKFSLGAYFPDFDEVNITVERGKAITNRVLLHEIVHAATETLISLYETNPSKLTDAQRAAAKRLNELYDYAVKNFPDGPKTYGLKNIYEFVAEAFTNKDFQSRLRDMPYKPANTSAWSRFVNTILKLLGYENVAANVLIEANTLFSSDRPQRPILAGPLFAPQQGPVSGRWRPAYDHNLGLIKLFSDAIKGRIPLDTALKEVTPALWNSSAVLARKTYLPLAPLRYLAEITKSKFPQLVGAIRLVEAMVSYRGRKMRVAEEIVKVWGALQSTAAGMRQSTLMSRVMIEASLLGEDPDKTPTSSAALNNAWGVLTPEAQSIYRRVRDFYADSLKEMVKEMKDRVRAEFAKDPNKINAKLRQIDDIFGGIKGPYFPLRRFGNYWFQVGTNDKNKEFYTFESVVDRELAKMERLRELRNGTQAERALAETIKSGNSIGEIYDQNKDPTGILGKVEELIDDAFRGAKPNVQEELKDNIHQLMFVLLPQQSMKKMFINRKGIQGASADMLRVFAESSVHSAYQQARFKYSRDFLNNLTNAKDYVKEAREAGRFSDVEASVYDDFIREVGARASTILSTEDKRLTAKAAAAVNEVTFFWLLSAPATAILNLLGAAQFSFSDMGGRYGYAKTAALLTKNMMLYGRSVPKRTIKPLLGRNFMSIDFPSMVEGGNLSPLQEMFADRFIGDQDINISLTNSLFEFGERPSALYTGRMNMLKKFASGLFHQAERFNREMVLMTAAELAYEKFLNEPIKNANGVIQRDASGRPVMRKRDATGFSQEAFNDAIAEARNVAGHTLGDFSRAMKPRVTTSPLGSVLFSMKSYVIMSTFYMVRNIDLSLNRPLRSDEMEGMRQELAASGVPQNIIDQRIQEAQAELKASYKEARKKMAGVLGVTFLLGGLQAQPFFTAVIGTLIKAMKPDDEEDDEFFDWENWFKNYMEINLGGFLGDMALKAGLEEKTAKKVGTKTAEAISGGLPAAAGAAFTERVSIDPFDLWYRSGRFSTDYRESLMETFIANAGPAVGLAMNFADAAQLMEQGRYQRAFERMLPAIVSKPITAARFAEEGAITKSGVTQVEEFTATELAMQAIGIQPERLAQKQKAAMAAEEKKQKILSRRNSIMNRLYLERNSESGYEYALEMMQEYNDKYPDYPITAKQIAASFKRRDKEAAEASNTGGAKIPKKLRARISPMTEYANDEED